MTPQLPDSPLTPSPVPIAPGVNPAGPQAPPSVLPASESGSNGLVVIGGVAYPVSSLLTPLIYWLSKPPAVQALWYIDQQTSGPSPARSAQAQLLTSAGYSIDEKIDVELNDPLYTMVSRFLIGVRGIAPLGGTWMAAINDAPGFVGPSSPLPSDAILTSFLAKDYPPFAPVAPPVTVPVPSAAVGSPYPYPINGKAAWMVAPAAGFTVANAVAGTTATAPDGTKLTLVIQSELVGKQMWWSAA